MIDEEILEYIKRYEVGIICDVEGRKTILVTNDLKVATDKFESIVKSIPNDYKFHLKVFIFDYDKNCNLNYYDSVNDAV